MKNKKLVILGMVLCVAVLGGAQTKQPQIARGEKIRQEIANAENELTEALSTDSGATSLSLRTLPARSLAKHKGWRRSNLVRSQ